MQNDIPNPIPLACVSDAIAAEERPGHFALIQRLFGSEVQERNTLANGYAFRFAARTFEDIARFIANERKCCPFLNFELTVSGADGPVWLGLTGPEGTREFLDAELPI